MASYGSPEYWNERYTAEPDPFEWYQGFTTLRAPLTELLGDKPEQHILQLGCGTSRLCLDLYDAGYVNQLNTDVSPVAITVMRERYAKYPAIRFMQMDARQLQLQDNSFDIVLDKGTLDCLVCGENAEEDAAAMLREVSRVLRPYGLFLLLTYGPEPQRRPYLEHGRYRWSLEQVRALPKPALPHDPPASSSSPGPSACHYLYVLRKDSLDPPE